MPIYTTTILQDFWEHNFQQGDHGPPLPLRIAYVCSQIMAGSPTMISFLYYSVYACTVLLLSYNVTSACTVKNSLSVVQT